mmetsp:Transcript_115681/g.322275  ORF Transcript_115681/g.322275 Transcript_115681/m.322275 type:complete len:560 (+) Transcript_115681:102-1781(+)
MASLWGSPPASNNALAAGVSTLAMDPSPSGLGATASPVQAAASSAHNAASRTQQAGSKTSLPGRVPQSCSAALWPGSAPWRGSNAASDGRGAVPVPAPPGAPAAAPVPAAGSAGAAAAESAAPIAAGPSRGASVLLEAGEWTSSGAPAKRVVAAAVGLDDPGASEASKLPRSGDATSLGQAPAVGLAAFAASSAWRRALSAAHRKAAAKLAHMLSPSAASSGEAAAPSARSTASRSANLSPKVATCSRRRAACWPSSASSPLPPRGGGSSAPAPACLRAPTTGAWASHLASSGPACTPEEALSPTSSPPLCAATCSKAAFRLALLPKSVGDRVASVGALDPIADSERWATMARPRSRPSIASSVARASSCWPLSDVCDRFSSEESSGGTGPALAWLCRAKAHPARGARRRSASSCNSRRPRSAASLRVLSCSRRASSNRAARPRSSALRPAASASVRRPRAPSRSARVHSCGGTRAPNRRRRAARSSAQAAEAPATSASSSETLARAALRSAASSVRCTALWALSLSGSTLMAFAQTAEMRVSPARRHSASSTSNARPR